MNYIEPIMQAQWAHIGESPWRGWRHPIVPITREALLLKWLLCQNRWHRCVHEDFDRDLFIYAWWPLVPFLRAWYGWRNSRYRFCIERAMRGRIADKPEGECWTDWTWKFRAPRDWTWHSTRRITRVGAKLKSS